MFPFLADASLGANRRFASVKTVSTFPRNALVLLCHKSCVAAWTSWEFAHESADKLNADGGDRMSDVAFRADRDCHEVRHLRIVEALCR
jgi:hypothetical protein